MCRQIGKRGDRKATIQKESDCRHEKMDGKYPGDKEQVDIKSVPDEWVKFPCCGDRHYPITGIDEYSRKRVLRTVKGKSTYETPRYPGGPFRGRDREREFQPGIVPKGQNTIIQDVEAKHPIHACQRDDCRIYGKSCTEPV